MLETNNISGIIIGKAEGRKMHGFDKGGNSKLYRYSER